LLTCFLAKRFAIGKIYFYIVPTFGARLKKLSCASFPLFESKQTINQARKLLL